MSLLREEKNNNNNNKAKVFQHPVDSQSASSSLISRHVVSARAVGARPRCSEFLSNRKYRYRSSTQTDDTHCWPWSCFPMYTLDENGKKNTSSGMTPSTCVFISFLPFLLFWTCCTHRYRRMSGPRHTMWIKLCVPQFPCWVIQLSVPDWLLWKRCTTQLLYK